MTWDHDCSLFCSTCSLTYQTGNVSSTIIAFALTNTHAHALLKYEGGGGGGEILKSGLRDPDYAPLTASLSFVGYEHT